MPHTARWYFLLSQAPAPPLTNPLHSPKTVLPPQAGPSLLSPVCPLLQLTPNSAAQKTTGHTDKSRALWSELDNVGSLDK